jgi:hypothetical protein
MKKSRNQKNIVPRSLGAGDVLVKRLTLPGISLTTGAGGTFPVTSFTSSEVQSLPATEWNAFSARYQQYRVRSVKIKLFPVMNFVDISDTSAAPLLAGTAWPICVASDYIGVSVPASATQCLSDEGSKQFYAHDHFTYTADWSRNPNARLWNPTSAAQPTANQFAIAVACLSAFTVSSVAQTGCIVFVGNVEWIVEFRGSQ